jgi:polyketide synthase PksJ
VDEVLADPGAFVAEAECAVFSEFALAADGLEEELIAIWERVLDVAPISVLDDFIDVGGESLHAIQIAAEISEKWEQSLTLVELLDASSVRGLARLIAASHATDA